MYQGSKTINKAVASRPDVKIHDIWPEADCAGPYWVQFDGFTVDNHGQHGWCGTAKEIASFIRHAVVCECDDCKKERACR